jgi:nitrogen fixation protein FixH
MQDVQPTEQVLTGRHVLLALAAFFGLVFAVNAYFIRVAVSTHTGVVANEPYRKGLKYNERIAADERQAALRWTDDISLSPDGGRIALSFKDEKGAPVRGLRLSGSIGRPATSAADKAIEPREVSPGQYEAEIGLAGQGSWIVSVEARQGESDSVVFRARKRLWLKP